jgi:hypothetical protein
MSLRISLKLKNLFINFVLFHDLKIHGQTSQYLNSP